MTTKSNEIRLELNKIFNSPPTPFTSKGSITATLILKCHNILGECILYDDITNNIVWTDILGKEFHSLNLSTGQHKVTVLPKVLGAFALTSQNNVQQSLQQNLQHLLPQTYLFAWEDGFQFYDLENKIELGPMSIGEDVNPVKLPTRLNDGRVDPTGKHFVCGGYFGSLEGTYMKVFSCKFDENDNLVHEAIVDKIQTTNSICWSNDGKTMYIADSEQKTIYQHDYNQEDGTLSNVQPLSTFNDGVPDGSCVDSKGNIWNALWRDGAGPSKVQCLDPKNGEVIYTVNMPDSTSQITCCCFGGPDLDVLFITTAHVNRDREIEPNAGCIYAVKLGVKGCLEKRFFGK